jgi:glucan phosphoethanolaminetransferase (alkaline phosphatase superfamily)
MIAKSKRLWGIILLISGCWAYSLATRFTNILFVSKDEKVAIFASLFIAVCVFIGWLMGMVLLPVVKSLPKKKVVLVFSVSAILAAIFFAFWYQLPPFPENHQLIITALGKRNDLSSGTRVEVVGVQK